MEGWKIPAKTTRKIRQTGGSKGVTLPPDWLRALGLDVKDSVDVLYNFVVLIKPKGLKLDPDFMAKELKVLANLEAEAPTKEASE